MLEAIESLRPQLAADTRFHLRHETFNLDAEAEIAQWLSAGRIDLLAFNDHMERPSPTRPSRASATAWSSAPGCPMQDFDDLVQRIVARANEVPPSIARLAEQARTAGVPMLSHDDESPEKRKAFRAQGVSIGEFPINEETAREAAAAGDLIVFGAPNVMRGNSHIGWTSATDMVAKGLCSVLASDYYYPAQLLAAFRLAATASCRSRKPGRWFRQRRRRPRASPTAASWPRAIAPISSWSTTKFRCVHASSR